MLKLTGGQFRGRSIETPRSDHTRPTQAKLRQALFNSLQTAIPDAAVLDLFAGSGALGLEALSRGAARSCFVEGDRDTAKLIHRNLETLKIAEQGRVRSMKLEPLARGLGLEEAGLDALLPFDVILADPPYAGGWELRLLEGIDWVRWLVLGGVFCLEWGKTKSTISELPQRAGCLVKVREKNYGDSVLTTYRRESLQQQSPPENP